MNLENLNRQKELIQRLSEMNVSQDSAKKISETNDPTIIDECWNFIIDGDMNPQMEVGKKEIEGFIDTLIYATENKENWDKIVLLEKLRTYYGTKKNFHIENEEFLSILNNSKNISNFEEIMVKKFEEKKREKINECVNNGYSDEQIDFFDKLTPRFIDMVISKMKQGMTFNEILNAYNKITFDKMSQLIVFKQELDKYSIPQSKSR